MESERFEGKIKFGKVEFEVVVIVKGGGYLIGIKYTSQKIRRKFRVVIQD